MSVSAFIDAWPLIGPAGWKTDSLANIIGDGTYQNSDDSDSPVTFDGVVAGTAVQVPQSSSGSVQALVGKTTTSPISSSTQVAFVLAFALYFFRY